MKEAIGEANLTTITILLIGSIIAVASLFIPRIMNTMEDRSCCLKNNGIVGTEKDNKTYCKIYLNFEEIEGKYKYLPYELSGFRQYCK